MYRRKNGFSFQNVESHAPTTTTPREDAYAFFHQEQIHPEMLIYEYSLFKRVGLLNMDISKAPAPRPPA